MKWEQNKLDYQEQVRRMEQQRNEYLRQQEEEQSRVKKLVSEAFAWRESMILRRYLRALEKQHVRQHGTIDNAGELGRWLAWAWQQADRIDPLTPSPPSILDQQPPRMPVPTAVMQAEANYSRYYPPTCCGVAFDDQGRVLLRKPKDIHGWTFAKGKMKREEVPKGAATREVLMKMGVRGTIPEGGPFRKSIVNNVLYYFYLMEHAETVADFDHEQTEQVSWLTPDEARKLITATNKGIEGQDDLATLEEATQTYLELNEERRQRKAAKARKPGKTKTVSNNRHQ